MRKLLDYDIITRASSLKPCPPTACVFRHVHQHKASSVPASSIQGHKWHESTFSRPHAGATLYIIPPPLIGCPCRPRLREHGYLHKAPGHQSERINQPFPLGKTACGLSAAGKEAWAATALFKVAGRSPAPAPKGVTHPERRHITAKYSLLMISMAPNVPL